MKQAASSRDTIGQFWRRVRLGAVLPYAAAAALLAVLIVIFGREILHNINALEAWITELGPLGVIVFIGLFAVLNSLLMPETVLGFIAGALFGLVGGTFTAISGTLTAASLQYLLSRHLLHHRIERTIRTRPSLRAIQRAVRSQEIRLQMLLRLTPLNPAVVSYALGAAGVRFGGFIIGCLALIPHLFLEVYFGRASKRLVRLAIDDRRTFLMHDAFMIGGLLVSILVMVIVSRMARKAVQKAVG